jgi:hypothetical protein
MYTVIETPIFSTDARAIWSEVIYFNRLENGVIYLLVIYAKTVRGTIPAPLLKAIQETIRHGNERRHDR